MRVRKLSSVFKYSRVMLVGTTRCLAFMVNACSVESRALSENNWETLTIKSPQSYQNSHSLVWWPVLTPWVRLSEAVCFRAGSGRGGQQYHEAAITGHSVRPSRTGFWHFRCVVEKDSAWRQMSYIAGTRLRHNGSYVWAGTFDDGSAMASDKQR